jgi:ABC-type lipoprotein release transport system permease subunit
VASLLVGIPLGIVAGRLSWGLVAGRLGVLPRPVLEAQVFALVTVIAIALANLVGLFASTRALRLRPSEVLRSE